MRITITGRNIELTPGIKEAVEDKLSKLEKYFKPDTDFQFPQESQSPSRPISTIHF